MRSEFAAVECLKASGTGIRDERALQYRNQLEVSKTHVICGMGDGFTVTTIETFRKIMLLSVSAYENGSLGSIDTENENMNYICIPDVRVLSLSPCEEFLAAASSSFLFVFHVPSLLEGVRMNECW